MIFKRLSDDNKIEIAQYLKNYIQEHKFNNTRLSPCHTVFVSSKNKSILTGKFARS